MRLTKKLGKNMVRKKSLKVQPRRLRNRRCGRVRRKTKRIVGKVSASRRIRNRGGAGPDVLKKNDLIINLLLNTIYEYLIPPSGDLPTYSNDKNTWICLNKKNLILATSDQIKIYIKSELVNEIINLYRGWKNTDRMAKAVGWGLKTLVGDMAFTLKRDLSLDEYDNETSLANRKLFSRIFTMLGDDSKIKKAFTALGMKGTLDWSEITKALHELIKAKSGTDITTYKDKINKVFDVLQLIQNFDSNSCAIVPNIP